MKLNNGLLKKEIIFLLLILLVAFFLRVWKLGTVPNGISNDEVVRVYGAYSIWETQGYGVNGSFLPLSSTDEGADFSPLSFYLSAPATGIFGLSLFTGRILYALIGCASVFMIYLLGKKLFTSQIALFPAFVLAVSPWHMLVSRGAWEAGVALFFFLSALFVFISLRGSRRVLWSLPLFALGLYSYHGTVVFFVLLIPLLFFVYRNSLISRKKTLILFTLGLVLMVIPMLIMLQKQSFNRENVLFWKSTSTVTKATDAVDFERQKSRGPFIVREIFNNKALYFLREVSDNYLEAFSPTYLFLHGDISRINAYGKYMWSALYLVELPFLLAGIYYLFKWKKKETKLLIFLGLLIAPVTSAIILEDRSYIFRSIMMLPFLSLLIGLGIHAVLSNVKKYPQPLSVFLIAGVCIVYAFFITKNAFTYFYQYGIYGGEYLFKSSRDVSMYIEKNHSQYDKVLVMYPEKYFLLQYAFFNDVDPKIIQSIWNNPDHRQYQNITFLSDCREFQQYSRSGNNSLSLAPAFCESDAPVVKKIRDIEEPQRVLWNAYVQRK